MKQFIRERLHSIYPSMIIEEGDNSKVKFNNFLKSLNASVEPKTGKSFEFNVGPSKIIFKPSRDSDTIVLELIETPKGSRGGGHASNALNKFLTVVDEYGYTVELMISPRDKETGFDKLGEFYQKFGFYFSNEGGFDSEFEMIR